MRFKLQHRYQDDGWEALDEEFDFAEDAIKRARKLAKKGAITHGMVRVIDTRLNNVVVTYPAGSDQPIGTK